MSRPSLFLGAVAALGLVASAYLFRENRALRAELARGGETRAAPAEPEAPAATSSGRAAAPAHRGPLGLSRPSSAERPELPETPKETRADRRRRRQEEIRAFLGRGADESEADYVARMKPLIESMLARPRERMAERLAEVEKLAKIDEGQKAKLEGVFEDTYREAIELTDDAVASGDLTPYRRNWSGALQFAGGMGAVLGSAEERIGGILSPEQRRIIADSGFEWGEFLGATTPWETLRPPPPDPGDDG